MKNSAALKRQMRYQQWVEEVKDFNARPKDMTVREWCAIHNIKPPTFYDHLRRVQDYYAGQIQSLEAFLLMSGFTIASNNALNMAHIQAILLWKYH